MDNSADFFCCATNSFQCTAEKALKKISYLFFANCMFKISIKILVKFHEDVKTCPKSHGGHILVLLECASKKGTKDISSGNSVFSRKDLVFVGLHYFGESTLFPGVVCRIKFIDFFGGGLSPIGSEQDSSTQHKVFIEMVHFCI